MDIIILMTYVLVLSMGDSMFNSYEYFSFPAFYFTFKQFWMYGPLFHRQWVGLLVLLRVLGFRFKGLKKKNFLLKKCSFSL